MNKKGWTIKEPKPGKYYLYTWEFDAEATQKKRLEMEEHVHNGNAKGYTKRDLQTKSSRYKWKSLGRFNLKKPGHKLQEFLMANLDQIPLIERRIQEMRDRTVQK